MDFNNVCKFLSYSYKVCYHSSIYILRDGVMVLPTDEALVILKLDSCPMQKDAQLQFKSTMIPPGEIFTPDVGVTRKDLHSKFNYENLDSMFNVMIDRTLSPGIKSSVSHRGYKLARWSPCDADIYHRPIIAGLTVDHRLTVYQVEPDRSSFKLILDLSQEFNQILLSEKFAIVSDRISETTNKDSIFTKLEEHTHALAGVDVVWSELWTCSENKDDQFSLLMVAMKSGHLVLWKVNFPVTNKSFEILEMVDMCRVIPSSLKIVKVNSQKCVLFVGFIDGQLKTFSIVRQQNDDFEVSENTPLWTDVDKISIGQMCWIEKHNVMLIGKGIFLMAYHLDLTQECIIIVQQSQMMVSDKLAISDICTNGEEIIVSVLDGSVMKCILHVTDSDLKTEVTNFPIQRPTPNRWGTNGVSLSPNGVYLYEVSHPISAVDHLAVREPLRLNCVELKTLSQVVNYLIAASTTDTGFSTLTDALVCVRCHALQEGVLPAGLSDFIAGDDKEVTLTHLRIKRYILQVQITILLLDTTNDVQDDKIDVEKKLEATEQRILLHHVTEQLKCLVKSGLQLTTTGNDITSICLMCKFIQNCPFSDADQIGLARSVCKVLNLLSEGNLPLVLEKCKICDADISTTHVYNEGCPNGHNIGRCCQTLLICQELPYRVCENCHVLAVAHKVKGSEWFEGLKRHLCTFCEGTVK